MLLLVYPISRHDVWKEYKSSKSSTIAHYLYAHHFSILRFCFCHLSGGECRLMVLTRVSTPPRIVSHRLLTAACMHSASRITLHSRCICPILPPPPPPLLRVGDGTKIPLSNSSDDHPSRTDTLLSPSPQWQKTNPVH
jgi:hypothetical protein